MLGRRENLWEMASLWVNKWLKQDTKNKYRTYKKWEEALIIRENFVLGIIK